MPVNDISLCSKPGDDPICSHCIRNPDNAHPRGDGQRWIKPDWNTFDNYCKYWLVYKDLEKSIK